MAETKRVSDQYTISAPVIIIDGNLVVQGTSTTVNSTDSLISDNVIVLNDGEPGAGITLGYSGIDIDRGSLDTAKIYFNESSTAWEIFIGNSFAPMKGAYPTVADHFATKEYVDNLGGVTAPGLDTMVIFNDGGTLGASGDFTWDGVSLTVGFTEITSRIIRTNTSNADLELYASGSGNLYFRSIIKLEDEVSDPSSVAGHNLIYSKAPGEGETGLYYVNSNSSGEVISKNKAIFYSMVL